MKTPSLAVTAVMALCVGFTAFIDTADAGKRSRRNAAIGVAAGLATLAIIAAASSSKKAHANEGYRRRGHGGGENYCARLLRRCNNGSNYSCEKYETGGCTE